jgi:glycosyltransferase involved in cell wall biosynthesis
MDGNKAMPRQEESMIDQTKWKLQHPRVTVLMPVYNAPLDMLEQAVDSILRQTYPDFELLIVDDGSTIDALHQQLRSYEQRDPRVRVAWEPHTGLTPTLNRGLALARGEFIARHDADDWSDRERFERQVTFLDVHPEIAVCGSNAWTHQEKGRALWQTRLPLASDAVRAAFPSGNPMVHGSTLFRTSAARSIGGYCEELPSAEDYDFFWRLTEQFGGANLPESLYHYRFTTTSISANKATAMSQSCRAIRLLGEARRRGELLPLETAVREAAAEMTSGSGVLRALLKQADHTMLAGNYRGAARSYWKLLTEHPQSPVAWAKLARLGLFRTMPFLREVCFR